MRDMGAPHFREIDLVGGRRSSKGFVTGIAMAKVMYDCLQLQDPGMHYGIDPEKEIYFSCVASAEIQAKKFQYADLVSTVENCRAFEPYMAKSLETEFGVMTPADQRKAQSMKARNRKVQRHVAKLRGNALASNASTLRGSATMGLAIDEMAHMLPGESRASAEQVFDAAMPSLDQFGQDAIVFCNSSPYTKVGKFYERYQEAMKLKDDGTAAAPMMFTLQFPSWALYDGYQDDRRFKKAITVSADWDPKEKNEDGTDKWSKGDQQQIAIAKVEEEQNPDKYKVERRGLFSEVIDAYLQPEMVDRVFFGRPRFIDNNELTYDPLTTNFGEGVLNVYRYAAHLDPSSTTAGFGFAMGHTEQLPDPQGNIGEHVVFDIVKRWQPQNFPGGVIKWETVIDEVLLLADIFRPKRITFDQFQSHAPIQELNRKLHERRISDIHVGENFATNEKNWNRAEIFKTAIYSGYVHAPYDTADTEMSALELKFLQQNNTAGKFPRVDKQDIGPVQTKDMADCMMTVVEYLIGNIIARKVRDELSGSPAMGAPGGYAVGGNNRTPSELAGYYGTGRQGEQRTALVPERGPRMGNRRRSRPIPRKLPGW